MVTTVNSKTLLEVKNLSVDYSAANGAVHAVDDVSFTLKRGEILGLAGESGCGKSTLAYAITRLLRPPAYITAGEVLYSPPEDRERSPVISKLTQEGRSVDGSIDILQLTPSQLRRFRWNELSIVFQSAMNALNPVLNVGAQIMDVLKTHRPEMGPDQRNHRAVELLNLVGIASDRLKSYPHELSGGMRQRAVIAIALALNPELIVMDEPTTALDVVVQREILELISSLCKEFSTALIFITHDLSLLLELADKVAIMYAGKIVEKATSKDLYLNPTHPYSYGLLNSFPNLHGPRRNMGGIPGSPPDLRTVPTGCAFHPRCPMVFDACRSVVPVLKPARSGETGDHTQLVACHLYDPRFAADSPTLDQFAAGYASMIEGRKSPMSALQQSTQPPTSESHTLPVLEAIHLRKEFPIGQRLLGKARSVHAVEDTSLALYPGRATALVGESGSGKTTVARMLARLYDPTSGTIKFHGEPVKLTRRSSTLRQYRRHIQLIFQDPFASLNPVHDVRYHLARPLRIFGHAKNRFEETQQILTLLNRVSLTPAEQFIQKYPHQLSGGQRQRIAIARALAVHPDVLLADEPVSMLDVSIRMDMLNLLLRLKDEEELALLYITHDIASARYFADDTLVMYAGQMVEGGPSEEVTQEPKHPYTRLLLSAAPDPDRLKTGNAGMKEVSTRGEIPSLINPPTGCRFHPRCPHTMEVCRQRFPKRTELGNGHWTHCFLYGDDQHGTQQPAALP